VELCPFGPFACWHTATTETLKGLSQDLILQNFTENCQDIPILEKTEKGTGQLTEINKSINKYVYVSSVLKVAYQSNEELNCDYVQLR